MELELNKLLNLCISITPKDMVGFPRKVSFHVKRMLCQHANTMDRILRTIEGHIGPSQIEGNYSQESTYSKPWIVINVL